MKKTTIILSLLILNCVYAEHVSVDGMMAYNMTKRYITNRLPNPAGIKFPGLFTIPEHIWKLQNNRYRIISWFDLPNMYGRLERVHFSCIIQKRSETQWNMIEFEIDE